MFSVGAGLSPARFKNSGRPQGSPLQSLYSKIARTRAQI